MTANTSRAYNAYSERLLSWIVPFVAVVVAIASIGTIISTISSGISQQRATHSNALDRADLALKNYLEPILRETQAIAANATLKNFINGIGEAREATSQAREFIAQNPTDILSVRYINSEGNVQLEVINSRGFSQITTELELGLRSNNYRTNSYFVRATSTDIGGVVMSNFSLQRDRRNGLLIAPPRGVVSLFVPVLVTANQVQGAVQIELDTQDFLNLVNRAEINFIDPLDQRHVILTAGNNLILADNTASNLQYFSDIELPLGNTGDSELYGSLVPYLTVLRPTNFVADHTGTNVISGRTIIIPLGDTSNNPFRLFIVDNLFSAYRSELLTVAVVVLSSLVIGFLAGVFLRWAVVRVLFPIEQAADVITRIANDDAPQVGAMGLTSSPIGESVVRIASQLETLNKQYQEQVERRNRDLRVVGRIGYETATLRDLEVVMKRAINLICNEMGFYHAQIFVVDEVSSMARLTYTRGEAGVEMLARNHQLAIGSPTVIGTTTAKRRPVILNDVSDPSNEVQHGFNPLLPETRAEMALPLIVGETLIGALDIQGKTTGVFLPQDLPTFELLAYQIAIAIYNTQLRTQSDKRIQQIDRLNRQLTRAAWENVSDSIQIEGQYGAPSSEKDSKAFAPISIRGETIGEIEVSLPEGDLTDGDQAVLQAIAERVSIAIENARLFQETQVSLAETSTLYELSRQLNESLTLEDVLYSIVTAVAPDATGSQMWLIDDDEMGISAEVRLAVDLPFLATRPATPIDINTALKIDEFELLKSFDTQKATLIGYTEGNESIDAPLSQLFTYLGAESVILVPLNMRGAWKGFITIEFPTQREFGEREQRVYDALVGQAGVAVDNRLLLQQTEEALARNEKLYSASRLINTARGLSDLVYAAVATTSDPTLNFWLGLLEGDADVTGWRNSVRVVAYSDMGNVIESSNVLPLVVDPQSPLRIREPEIVTAEDAISQPNSYAVQRMQEAKQSFMAMFPLYIDNLPIALFYIVSNTSHELSQEDFDVYKALTGQMSTQIQNRRLLERTEAALNETRRLYVASRAIASAQDIVTLYESLASHVAAPFAQATASPPLNVTLSVLLARPLPSPTAPELEYVYQWSSDSSLRTTLRLGTSLRQADVPLGYMLEQSDENALVYSNVRNIENGALRSLLRQDSSVAAVITPLQVRQQWFGVMILHADKASIITDSYVRFLQAVADQVAVAIENQNLLQNNIFERANLTNILSTLPAGVLVLEPSTFLPRQTNERIEELLGRKIDMSKPFSAEGYALYRNETHTLYPDELLPFFVAQTENRAAFSDDVTVVNGDMRIDLLINAAPIYDNRGNITAIVTAFQDITNLRSLENTLQQNLRETVTLYETQLALAKSEVVDEMLDTLIEQLTLQQMGDIYIVLTDEEGEEIRLMRQTTDAIMDAEPLRFLLQLEPVSIESVSNSNVSDDIRAVLRQMDAESAFVAPLIAKMRTTPLGWLVVTHPEPYKLGIDPQRILTTMADMSSTAIDNNYLVASTQIALQETASLYGAASSINRSSNLQEVAIAIETSLDSLQADMFAVYVMIEGQVQVLVSRNFEEAIANGLDLEELVTVPLRDDGSGIYVVDLMRSSIGRIERMLLESGQISTLAIANLRIKDEQGGRIFVGYHSQHTLSVGEQRFLTTVSDSASVVINNIVLLEEIQGSLQETSTIYQASRALTDASNPLDVLNVITDFLIDPSIDRVMILMLNRPQWDSVAARAEVAVMWQVDGKRDLMGMELSAETFGAWEQLSTDRILSFDNINDPDSGLKGKAYNEFAKLGANSVALIPLRVPSRSIGVIWLSRSIPAPFIDRELRVYQAFAEQTSLSLEASRLLAQTERRAGQLETTTQIAQRVGQIIDIDQLLPQVVNLIRDQFGYDHVQVFLMDNKNDWAILRASTGDAGRQLLAVNHALQKGSRSVIGRVTETGEITLALDTADANVVHKPNPYLPNTRSELALPLIIQDRVVGALDVQSNRSNAFEQEDIQALTALAAQIAIAIDNVRLYDESQSRANELAFLFDVTTAATAADTLKDALQAITERLADSMETLTAAIYLPQKYTDAKKNVKTLMKPTALVGGDQPISELSEVAVGDSENLIGIVASTLQSQIVPNIAREVRYAPISSAAQSAIMVPISSGSELVGMVILEDESPNAYDNDTLTLMLTLGGSLAAVIQNTLLVDRLQSSNEQLREIDRLKSQFLANMSHELRTPLNSIIGFSRIMLKGIGGTLSELQEQDLTTIYNSGQHLLRLINDILDQAKIEANEMTVKSAYFDVKPTVEGVKSIAIGLMKDKTLQLIVEVAPNMPQAYADEFRTRQILLNLMSNAIKFTEEGSVTLRVYATSLDDGQTTVIRADVIDTGHGIDEKDMPILFEQFRQIDNSLTRTVGGTGLGLPISKAFAELQGGRLFVESRVGEGSVFSVIFPTKPLDGKQDDQKPLVSADETKPNADTAVINRKDIMRQATQIMPTVQAMPTKREVLLVEDNKDVVDQYRRALQREGFDVQTADHPSYAEAMVGQMRPTVVVMDVNFAAGQGWAILQNLKRRDDTSDIPIVVSSLSNESERAIEYGAYQFIQRPFMPDVLVKAVLLAEKEQSGDRILIIDDQPEAIRLLKQLLSQYGNYRVYEAESGKEGISLVARRRPSLIILDLRMPDMDGFAVLDELRANPETASIPVMVVTGDVDLAIGEREQLQNIRVVPKSGINEETYNVFLNDVKSSLTNRNR